MLNLKRRTLSNLKKENLKENDFNEELLKPINYSEMKVNSKAEVNGSGDEFLDESRS